MNERDLFAAIGNADEKLLENSERTHRVRWERYLAAAACLLLFLAAALQLIQPPIQPAEEPALQPLPGQNISTEKIDWLQEPEFFAEELPPEDMMLAGSYFYDTQFCFLMSIEARVLDVLPDIYVIPGSSTHSVGYRILRLEVLDTIQGSNMSPEIFYLLPEYLSADLKQFDSLIMTVIQLGCENTLMLNSSQQRMETFDYLFYGTKGLEVEQGAVIAFSDGQLDMGLWELDGWDSRRWIERLTNPLEYPEYPAKKGRSVDDVKKVIPELVQAKKNDEIFSCVFGWHTETVVGYADFDWPEAQSILEYVKPFDNGYFAVHCSGFEDRTVVFNKIVNGFATNERIIINLDKRTVQISDQYTDADLKRLPDLVKASMLGRSVPAPEPRVEPYPYDYCGVRAQYEKKGNAVFGIVTVYWGYSDMGKVWGESWSGQARIYDSVCIVVYPDGRTTTCKNSFEADALIDKYLYK